MVEPIPSSDSVERHALGFFIQFAQQVVERGVAEVDAGGQRVVDPHVKPGFDRAIEKEHRGAIHHQAGHRGDDTEHQQQFQRELGAEHAAADAFLQPPQAPAQQHQQCHTEHAAADEQGGQGIGERAAVAAGRKQQE